jgi:hypothetical protein
MARGAMEDGHWLTPFIYGERFAERPVLLSWLAALFGDPAEVRKSVATDPESRYQGINPDDVPDLLEEEEEGLEPKGAAAGLAKEANESDGDRDQAESAEPEREAA